MTGLSRRAVSAWSVWAPSPGSGDDDVDDAERLLLGARSCASRPPRSAASSAVRHRIEAQPSGLITE